MNAMQRPSPLFYWLLSGPTNLPKKGSRDAKNDTSKELIYSTRATRENTSASYSWKGTLSWKLCDLVYFASPTSYWPSSFCKKPLHGGKVSSCVLAEVTIVTLNPRICSKISKWSSSSGENSQNSVSIENWMEFSRISTGESNRDITVEILTKKLDMECPRRVLCRARSLTYPFWSLFDPRLDRNDFPADCVCITFWPRGISIANFPFLIEAFGTTLILHDPGTSITLAWFGLSNGSWRDTSS